MESITNCKEMIAFSNNIELKRSRIHIFNKNLPETDMLTMKDVSRIASVLCERNQAEMAVFVSKSRVRMLIALESLIGIGVLPPFIFPILSKMFNINSNSDKVMCMLPPMHSVTINVSCGCFSKLKNVSFNSFTLFCACYDILPMAKFVSQTYVMENYVQLEDLHLVSGKKINHMLAFSTAFLDLNTTHNHPSILGLAKNRGGYQIVSEYDITVDKISENLYCDCDFAKYAYDIASEYVENTQMYCLCMDVKQTQSRFDCKSLLETVTGKRRIVFSEYEYMEFTDFVLVAQLVKVYIRGCCPDHQSVVVKFLSNSRVSTKRQSPSAALIVFMNNILKSLGRYKTKTTCYPQKSVAAHLIDFLDTNLDVNEFMSGFIELFIIGMTNVSVKMIAESPSALIGGMILCFWDIQNAMLHHKLITIDMRLTTVDLLFYVDGCPKPSNAKKLEQCIPIEKHIKMKNEDYLIYKKILENNIKLDFTEMNYYLDVRGRFNVADEFKKYCVENNIHI